MNNIIYLRPTVSFPENDRGDYTKGSVEKQTES